MNATADLLIRREADANGAVGNVVVLQQMARRRHDDGETGLVVRTQERRTAGGDDVIADLGGQVGRCLWRQHLVGRIRQHDGFAGVAAMDKGLDAGSAVGRRRVHMSQQRNGRRRQISDCGRNGGQQRPVLGQDDVMGADGFQLLFEKIQQVKLLGRTWCRR